MYELKFQKEAECERRKKPGPDNIYSGFFKFTTQTTAVYDGYCLIDAEDEIMKISVDCKAAFFNGKNIALLREGKIEIYTNKELETAIPVHGSSNVRDYLPDFSKDLDRLSDTTDIFFVGDKEMKIEPERIYFGGKEYLNEIHEPGSRYFVAWYDKLTVLGNNKSLNFVYFYDGIPAEIDEYNPVSLRIDENSLDSIPVVDMKFWKGQLLLIDESMINVFTVDKVTSDKSPSKPMVSYSISNGKLSRMNDLFTDAEIGSENEVYFNKSSTDLNKSNIETIDLGKSSSQVFDLKSIKSSIGKADPMNASAGSNLSLSPNTSVATLNSLSRKDSLQSKEEAPTKEDLEKNELKKLDLDFLKRFETLKTSFAKLDLKKPTSHVFQVLPSHFNLDGLYNLIFHNHIEEYEDAAASMIFQVENLKGITECNIVESIKYIDSKIFAKRMFKVPIKYHDPLCVKFTTALKISNPVADLLDGIKVLNIQTQKANMKLDRETTIPKDSLSKPILSTASSPSLFTESTVPLKITNNSPPSANFSATSMLNQSGAPPNLQSAAALNQANASTSYPSNIQSGNPSSVNLQPRSTSVSNQPTTSPNLGSVSLPYGASIGGSPSLTGKGITSTLFNNQPQGNSSSLFVKDTSTLFDSIAANTLSVHSPQTQQTNEQPNENGDKPVSAFNRLASSRKIFK